MSDQDESSSMREPSELEILKDRARKMGINFSNNIGVEALKGKINAKQEGLVDNTNADGVVTTVPPVVTGQAPGTLPPAEDTIAAMRNLVSSPVATSPAGGEFGVAGSQTNGLTGEKPITKTKTLQQMMRDEQMKLVRIRISCLDPKKKDLPGEIFTVANEYLGTVKKYVPFGEFTEDGYHVPYCIYTMLKSRKFLNIVVTKDRRTGHTKVNQTWATEFSIDILDPLTQEELNRLATAQAAAGSMAS